MDRNLSLITPTGQLTLGNHLGALRRFVAAQDSPPAGECFFGLCDLHALTTPQDPAVLRSTIAEMATLFLAAGLDPARVTLFRQSQVPAHRELAYLLECTAYTGELNRMIQFKEKGRGVPSTRASLYTYPALMAADILLYRPSVGAGRRRPAPARRADPRPGDPVQPHLRAGLRRARGADAGRGRAGDGPAGAHPRRCRSRPTASGDAGVIRLLDPPDVVRRKVARAVTDSDTGPDAVRSAPDEARGDQPARHPRGLRRVGRGPHDVRRAEVGGHRGRGRDRSSRCRRPTPSSPPTRRTSSRSSPPAPRTAGRSPPPSSPTPPPRWGCEAGAAMPGCRGSVACRVATALSDGHGRRSDGA